jgi:GH24 family phage-related lysozyme (muramidase)
MAKWKWCLEDETSGILLTGWQQVEGKWYYLNSNGTMVTGWLKENDKWYYLDNNGVMKVGWLQDNNKRFYLGKDGVMIANCISVIDGKSYSFSADGALIENTSLVSDKLVDFVKHYEGFRATSYIDPAGVKTIGYGTTKKEYVALGEITEVQATQFLKEEINGMAKKIKTSLDSKGVVLTQNQFDALCSFAYNCGVGGLLGSTLYSRILAGVRDSSLKDNFAAWSKAGGKILQGLLNRRIEEYQIFANADYIRNF